METKTLEQKYIEALETILSLNQEIKDLRIERDKPYVFPNFVTTPKTIDEALSRTKQNCKNCKCKI